MKLSEEEEFKKVIKKYNFEKTFPKEIKKEKSPLGKLLLQENYIFFKIIKLLDYIIDFINMSDNCLKKKYLGKINKILINLPDKKKVFETYTLGRLINLLKIFRTKKSVIIKKLEGYTKDRNKLTHRMFYEYDSISLIKKDAKELTIGGDEILDEIDKLISKYANDIQSLIKLEKNK